MAYFCQPQQEKFVRQTLSCEEYGQTVINLIDGNNVTEKDIDCAINKYYKLEKIIDDILMPMLKFCSEIVSKCNESNIHTYGIGLINEYVYKFTKITGDLKNRIRFLELIQLIMTDDPLGFIINNPEYLKHDIYSDFFGVSEEQFETFIKNLNSEEIFLYLKNNDYHSYIKAYEKINSLFISTHPALEVDFNSLVFANESQQSMFLNVLRHDDLDNACDNMEKIKNDIILPIYKFCCGLIHSKIDINPSYIEKFKLLAESLPNPICYDINYIEKRIFAKKYSKKFLYESKILMNDDVFSIVSKPEHILINKIIIEKLRNHKDYLFDRLELQDDEYIEELYKSILEIVTNIKKYLTIFY